MCFAVSRLWISFVVSVLASEVYSQDIVFTPNLQQTVNSNVVATVSIATSSTAGIWSNFWFFNNVEVGNVVVNFATGVSAVVNQSSIYDGRFSFSFFHPNPAVLNNLTTSMVISQVQLNDSVEIRFTGVSGKFLNVKECPSTFTSGVFVSKSQSLCGLGCVGSFSCGPGFIGQNVTGFCQPDATWNTTSVCSIACSAAPAPSTNGAIPTYSTPGVVVGGSMSYINGTQASYTCIGDFAISSTTNALTCLNGSWSSTSPPTCAAVCPASPAALNNGISQTYNPAAIIISSNTKYKNGTVAVYGCSPGYSTSTTTMNMLICLEGTWSPSNAPLCELICNSAPIPQLNSAGPAYSPSAINGTTTYKKGTIAVYTCAAGFSFPPTESNTLTCGRVTDGQWEKMNSPPCVSDTTPIFTNNTTGTSQPTTTTKNTGCCCWWWCILLIILFFLIGIFALVLWTIEFYICDEPELGYGIKFLMLFGTVTVIPIVVYVIHQYCTSDRGGKRESPLVFGIKDWGVWFILCIWLPLILGILMFRQWQENVYPKKRDEPKQKWFMAICIVLGIPMVIYYFVDKSSVKQSNSSGGANVPMTTSAGNEDSAKE